VGVEGEFVVVEAELAQEWFTGIFAHKKVCVIKHINHSAVFIGAGLLVK
jgi:hypothetical protein